MLPGSSSLGVGAVPPLVSRSSGRGAPPLVPGPGLTIRSTLANAISSQQRDLSVKSSDLFSSECPYFN